MSLLYCFYCDIHKQEHQFSENVKWGTGLPLGIAGNQTTVHTHPEGRLKCKDCVTETKKQKGAKCQ